MLTRKGLWTGAMLPCLMAMGVSSCSEGTETGGSSGIPAEQGQISARSASNSMVDILAWATEGGWQNVDLLVTSDDPLGAAQECVRNRPGATSCYAFISREAYRAAEPVAPGNFTLTCWAARWTRNKVGSMSGGINDFMPPACPASAKPRAPEPADDSSVEPSSAESFRLELTLEPAVTSGNQILLEGSTNLPDGTKLSTSVSGGGFMGQDEAIVIGGRWRSGPFGPQTGLQSGGYEASVTLPYGRTQPEPIQAQLGKRLEKLSGPLMETDPNFEFMGQSATVESVVTMP